MTWLDRRIWAFDLETTGANPQEARIVSAAVVACGGGQPIERHEWLIAPAIPIEDGAAAVHGITNERAAAEGADPADAVAEILDTLNGREPGDAIVAYNARFDLTILAREAARLDYPMLDVHAPMQVVDPFVIDKFVHRYRSGSRKLDATCAFYGVTLGDAHAAGADALAAARLAWHLGRNGRVVRRTRTSAEQAEFREASEWWDAVRHDLPTLHVAQITWALEQRAGLVKHFRKKGQHDDADRAEAEVGWPVLARNDDGPS